MYLKIRKRTFWVFVVLALVTVVGLCAGLLVRNRMGQKQADSYRSEVASGWRQSVSELSEALRDLETGLQKGLYSSGDYQTVSWAARVFSDAGAARTALEALPVYELRLSGTETFLNQVGEFTLEMARKRLRGETLTDGEKESLERLALRSRQLADEVMTLSERISDENPGYDELQQLLTPSGEGEDKTEFESFEDIFAGDTPLTYDGEHSAWREGRTSDWLKTMSETPKADLKKAAAAYLSVKEEELTEESRLETPFAFREYRSGDFAVAVTERGGLLYGMTRLREVSEAKLSAEETLSFGREGLTELGYANMEPVAWHRNENTLTAVYVLRKDGVLVYADRVTVTMAMDNGEILTFNGTEYLLGHAESRDLAPSLTREEAMQVLRHDLTVEAYDLALVPGGDGKERLCWQFTVRDETETRVMVFVNAETKVEEEILILIEDEDLRTAL